MTALLIPLDLPGDAAEHAGDGGGFLEPFLGLGLLGLLIALLVTYLLLVRRGLLPAFAWPTGLGRRDRPEDAARQILAERFAHGDLTPEEFMERASALNWTPGVEPVRRRAVGRS